MMTTSPVRVLVGRKPISLTQTTAPSPRHPTLGEGKVIASTTNLDEDHQGISTENLAQEVGLYALEVVALHDQAHAFYERFGFLAFADDPLHLYLSVEKMRKLHLHDPA